jgi:glycerol-3-phosphate acyltransferase PlsY
VAIEFGLLVLGAYFLGSVPTAYIAAKWFRGVDIRQYSDGNVGTANLMRLTSKRIAIPVMIFDLSKGAVMVWGAQLMGLDTIQQVSVGLAAIIGHNWPIFLRFNGGRGIFTGLGVVSILVPWLGLAILVISYSLAPFRQLALGVFLATVFAPIGAWFLSQPLGIDDRLPLTLGFFALFLVTSTRRLTAPRTSFTDSVPLGWLLINRLLFDRDIKDREAWINQHPLKQSEKQRKD